MSPNEKLDVGILMFIFDILKIISFDMKIVIMSNIQK